MRFSYHRGLLTLQMRCVPPDYGGWKSSRGTDIYQMVLKTTLDFSYRSRSIPIGIQHIESLKLWDLMMMYFVRRLRLQLLKNLLRLCFSCGAHGAVVDDSLRLARNRRYSVQASTTTVT